MTDAERISEHIRAITYQTWDAKAIEDMLADMSAYVPGSYMDQVKRLAAMLEQVRKEERRRVADSFLRRAGELANHTDDTEFAASIREGTYDR